MKVLKARVSAELHARVKVQAAINGESIEALLIEAIVHRLPAAQR